MYLRKSSHRRRNSGAEGKRRAGGGCVYFPPGESTTEQSERWGVRGGVNIFFLLWIMSVSFLSSRASEGQRTGIVLSAVLLSTCLPSWLAFETTLAWKLSKD